MNSEQLLTYLESCPKGCPAYIRCQAEYIRDHIYALRRWANLKSGDVADVYNKRADKLEARLTRLLDSLHIEENEDEILDYSQCDWGEDPREMEPDYDTPAARESSQAPLAGTGDPGPSE